MMRLIGFLLLSMAAIAYADSNAAKGNSVEQERMYLVQLVNQLNATMPMIRAAERAQPKNQRTRFHYRAWQDAQGQKHNGLLEDVQTIKKGVEEKLNVVSIEPRAVVPVRGDYLEPHIKN
jgi:RAQPRD family integrative conjugative element protein